MQDPFQPVERTQVEVYKYVPIKLEMCGPDTPAEDMLANDG